MAPARSTSWSQRAKALGMNGLALTDHGNLHGALEFYQAAKKEGINPILGYEAYIAPDSRLKRDAGSLKEASYHLTLLAQNRTGFRNLIKLASKAFLEGFYFKPRIDRELLEEFHEGIICLSGCVSSEFSRAILKGAGADQNDLDEAKKSPPGSINCSAIATSSKFKTTAWKFSGGRWKGPSKSPARWAFRWWPRATPTTSIAKMPKPRTCCCASTPANSAPTRTGCGWKRISSILRSPEEMYAAFPGFEEALKQSQEIADSVNIELELGQRHFPTFEPPESKTPTDYLRELCIKGLRERYADEPERCADGELDGRCRRAARSRTGRDQHARLSELLSDRLGFRPLRSRARIFRPRRADRASARWWLTRLYLSHVCPLKYDLLFERFLDVNRREAPDIDIDFCKDRRGEVIQYVKEKYGAENVAQIGTFGTLAARAAIRDVGRRLAMPIPRVDAIVAMVPEVLNISLDEALEQSADLKKAYETDGEVRELLDLARKIEGLARNVGTHAAAVVIADRPLTEYVPLCRGAEQRRSHHAMGDGRRRARRPVEDGLSWPAQPDDPLQSRRSDRANDRRARRSVQFPLDDRETFALLCRGETKGIFQLESGGIRDLLQKMKPDHFRDIIATNALYRPGPLEGGMVDDYVQVKHGRKQAELRAPGDERSARRNPRRDGLPRAGDANSESPGRHRAGQRLHLHQGDQQEEAADDRQVSRGSSSTGPIRQGLSEKQAGELFGLIEKFAGYGFNKSHSTAYALIAYMTAYLKAHYPVEFMAALLSGDMDGRNFKKKDSLVEHLEDCRRMGLEVVPPDVNNRKPISPCADGKIVFALAAIKGCGGAAGEAIAAGTQNRRTVPQPVRFLRTVRSLGGQSHGDRKFDQSRRFRSIALQPGFAVAIARSGRASRR